MSKKCFDDDFISDDFDWSSLEEMDEALSAELPYLIDIKDFRRLDNEQKFCCLYSMINDLYSYYFTKIDVLKGCDN